MFDLLKEVLLESEFRSLADVGVTIQTSQQSAEQDLASWIKWAEKRGTRLPFD